MQISCLRAAPRFLRALALSAAVLGSAVSCGPTLVSGDEYADRLSRDLPDLAALAPGEYSGAYTVALPPGAVAMSRRSEVLVTIGDESGVRGIRGIKIVVPESYPDDGFLTEIVVRVMDAQSLDVDVVSGATYSSLAFLKAVENALSK